MTRRELDIFTIRGLIGLVRIMEGRPKGGYPRIAKLLVHGSHEKILNFLGDIIDQPLVEEYEEVEEKEFERWLLQGLTTLSEFVERLGVENNQKVTLYRKLSQQMRLIIQEIQAT